MLRRNSFRLTTPWLVLGLTLTLGACASGPFNSNPSCRDCDKFLKDSSLEALRAGAGSGSAPEEDPCEHPVPTVDTSARFDNLVFEGGGVKGTAYVGALEVLGKAGLLDSVETVAGTSAGAITALMVALGLEPSEIRHLALDVLDFRDLEDGSCFLGNTSRLVHRYGWYKGDFFLCFIECLIDRSLGDRRATFGDLAERVASRGEGDPRFRNLFVVGTDVTTNRSVVFNAMTHRDMALADAVRISMSIPFFFAAREADEAGKPDLFVDGGVLRNYPINLFDPQDGPVNSQTLGFHLGTAPQGRNDTSNVVAFTRQLVATLLDVQVDALCNRSEDVRRSVFINPLGIGTTDFDITRKQKCELIASGIDHTVTYLETSPPAETCPDWLEETLSMRAMNVNHRGLELER